MELSLVTWILQKWLLLYGELSVLPEGNKAWYKIPSNIINDQFLQALQLTCINKAVRINKGLKEVSSCRINAWPVPASNRAFCQPKVYQEERLQTELDWVKKTSMQEGEWRGPLGKGTHLVTAAHQHTWILIIHLHTNISGHVHIYVQQMQKREKLVSFLFHRVGKGVLHTHKGTISPTQEYEESLSGQWFVPTTNIQHMSRKSKRKRHVRS